MRKMKALRETTYRAERDDEMLHKGCVSVPVAAVMLSLSRPRVYAMATDDTLSTVQIGGSVYVTVRSIKAYRESVAVPAGLILMSDAQKEFHYSRATLWRRVLDGTLRKEIINERAYLHRIDLDKLYGSHTPTLSIPTKNGKRRKEGDEKRQARPG
jgi:predicted DNA-binding transcriptional regulator AlpA